MSTLMFIIGVFTYLMVGEQAATAQQPIEVEQNCVIVDSLAKEVDGLCYAVLHPEDSIYSQKFLSVWREKLEAGIQSAVISYQLTPSDLFQIMQPMHDMNISQGHSMDMDCAIRLWDSFPEAYVEEFWDRYFIIRDEYYK